MRSQLRDDCTGIGDDLSGLNRTALNLMLAAIAHAAGSHEHFDMMIDNGKGTCVLIRHSSLYAWIYDVSGPPRSRPSAFRAADIPGIGRRLPSPGQVTVGEFRDDASS